MTTISHDPSRVVDEKRRWSALLVSEMWAALAIIVIWLALLFDAIYGPDIVTTSGAGGTGTTSTIPSAVVVAPFAFLATWVVARHGFPRGRRE